MRNYCASFHALRSTGMRNTADSYELTIQSRLFQQAFQHGGVFCMQSFRENIYASMAEKHSLYECSSAQEVNYFTLKDQSHVHCPCEKCKVLAVYAMVAWRHM